jgi:hypothetical protein
MAFIGHWWVAGRSLAPAQQVLDTHRSLLAISCSSSVPEVTHEQDASAHISLAIDCRAILIGAPIYWGFRVLGAFLNSIFGPEEFDLTAFLNPGNR